MDYACPIQYNAEYRQVETQGKGRSTARSLSQNSDSEDNPGITNLMTGFDSWQLFFHCCHQLTLPQPS
jgi:hypothetical protein